MSSAIVLHLPEIDWRTVEPWEWQYLGDLIGTAALPVPAPPDRPSGIVISAEPERVCICAHCKRHPAPETEIVDEPRRELGVGPFGARKSHEPSRYLESREVVWRIALKLPAPPYKRPSRANFEPKPEPPRMRRPLTPTDNEAALSYLKTRIARASLLSFAGGRLDWVHEVWLELVNPPADIEQPPDLWVRVDRAIGRVEKRFRAQMVDFSAANGPYLSRGVHMRIDDSECILSDGEHALLVNRVEVFGEVRAAEMLRMSRTSVLRLLSRRPVRLGTISLARIGLSKKAV